MPSSADARKQKQQQEEPGPSPIPAPTRSATALADQDQRKVLKFGFSSKTGTSKVCLIRTKILIYDMMKSLLLLTGWHVLFVAMQNSVSSAPKKPKAVASVFGNDSDEE